MSTLVLTLLINSYCLDFMASEYGPAHTWDAETAKELPYCLEETIESDIFYWRNLTHRLNDNRI